MLFKKRTPPPEPKPVQFAEANFVYKAPEGMRNCGDLPCYRSVGQAISCWHFPFRERLRFLFTGHMWLYMMVNFHPPVALTTRKPFEEQKPEPLPKLK